MIRVPSRSGSLAEARAEGAAVQLVYAANQAVRLAAENPGREVVFLGIGFETTAPATALAVRQARQQGLRNFSVLGAHKRLLPAMDALLLDTNVRIDGFLCPGHVSVILGWQAFEPIARAGRPCVVAGFEPPNIALGVLEILRQLQAARALACTVYPVVTAGGNATAQQVLAEVFDVCDARWRALGTIPASGLALKREYAEFDAVQRFGLREADSYEPPGCLCGQVITGRRMPTDCPLFGKTCTPAAPVGPCMVSSEGSCAAHYKYHGLASPTGAGEVP